MVGGTGAAVNVPNAFDTHLRPGSAHSSIRDVTTRVCRKLSFKINSTIVNIGPIASSIRGLDHILSAVCNIVSGFGVPARNYMLTRIAARVRTVHHNTPNKLVFRDVYNDRGKLGRFNIRLTVLSRTHTINTRFGHVTKRGYLCFRAKRNSTLSTNTGFNTSRIAVRTHGCKLTHRCSPFVIGAIINFVKPRCLCGSHRVVHTNLRSRFVNGLDNVSVNYSYYCAGRTSTSRGLGRGLVVLLTATNYGCVVKVPLNSSVVLGCRAATFRSATAIHRLLGLHPSPRFRH